MTVDVMRLAPPTGPPLEAGGFSRWLDGMRHALSRGGPSDVPCDGCTACCEGAYFIHVRAGEAALARIPTKLLFPAPGGVANDRVMGHDRAGRCPMLTAGGCTIYEDRPGTCRTYDCRIFTATGLAEPGAAKAAIMDRAARWRFSYADPAEHDRHRALKAVAWSLVEAPPPLADLLPGNATQLAMLVVRVSELLLDPDFTVTDAGQRARLQAAIDAV